VIGEYGISGEEDDRLEALSGGGWAVAGSVAWARAGGESGGVEIVYRAGSSAGGEDSGGGAEGESAELEEVLARRAGFEPDKDGWVELFIARAIAERVELLRDPGERWMR
jgi:hypothetical protein